MMAWRTFSTPTLPGTADPAAGADCAPKVAAPIRLAAARAAETNILFTVVSLLSGSAPRFLLRQSKLAEIFSSQGSQVQLCYLRAGKTSPETLKLFHLRVC